MRPLFFLTIMLVFANCLSASSQIDSKENEPDLAVSKLEKVQEQKVLESVLGLSNEHTNNKVIAIASEAQLNFFGKCTIKVHAEFDNGVVIEGTVVIEGIPWYECLGLKIYDLFSSEF